MIIIFVNIYLNCGFNDILNYFYKMQKIFLFIFIGLIFSIRSEDYDVKTGTNWIPSDKIDSNTKATDGLIKYFLRFAAIGYCYNGEYEKGKCCKSTLTNAWELVGYGKETLFSYNYIIFKSKIYKKLLSHFQEQEEFHNF